MVSQKIYELSSSHSDAVNDLKKKSNFGYLCFPGDAVLRQESQLCLTATSLVFLNQCFDIVSSGKLSVCDIFLSGASIREEMIL